MSRLTCSHCSATTEGVVLCKRCQTTVTVALQAIKANHVDLFNIADAPPSTRRRSGPSDPTGSAVATASQGDPIELAAAQALDLLDTWARRLLAARPETGWPARVSVAALADHLGKNLRTIATQPWAGELLRELLTCERKLKRLVSGNRGYWYGGICGAATGDGPDDWCPADLFVNPGERWVRCRGCGHHWSVDQRRAEVIAQARDTLLPVPLIARAVVSLLDGEPSQQRLEARLRKWVERGQLDDYGVRVLEGRPRRVYRLGDVIDRLTREMSGVMA